MKKHMAIAGPGLFFGLFLYLYFTYDGGVNQRALQSVNVVYSGLTGILTAYAIYFLTRQLDKLLPWDEYTGVRLLSGIMVCSAASLSIIWILSFLHYTIFQPGNPLIYSQPQNFAKLSIIVFILVLIFSIVYFALYSYQNYAKGQLEIIRLERQQTDLQLKSLKSQLSPHFLFNCLSTISMLLHMDPGKAENFIRRLATLYQYTLNSYHKKWVRLSEEIDFVKSYHYLLKTRFEDYLALSIHIPESLLQTRVPPLTLQLLVENVVKHNVAGPGSPLFIVIKADEKWLHISNNKTTAPERKSSFRIGLANIRNRYQILSGKGIDVIDNEKFTVKIPIIR